MIQFTCYFDGKLVNSSAVVTPTPTSFPAINFPGSVLAYLRFFFPFEKNEQTNFTKATKPYLNSTYIK